MRQANGADVAGGHDRRRVETPETRHNLAQREDLAPELRARVREELANAAVAGAVERTMAQEEHAGQVESQPPDAKRLRARTLKTSGRLGGTDLGCRVAET